MEEEKTQQISEQEVNQVLKAFDFLEFSNGYREAFYHTSFLTPDVVNQQMKNITMNPATITSEGLEDALKSPKQSEDIIRRYAESIENNNMTYKRNLHYFPDLAAFNLTFDCTNFYKDSELNSDQYKADQRVLEDFLSRFDYRYEFALILRQIFRQGAFFGILRSNGDKYTIQELPIDFCKITGRSPYGFLFDFNMNWFIGNYGVDISQWPKVFRKMYRDVFNNMGKQYDPALSPDKRNSTFAYWHQCNPDDGFWAFKLAPEVATIIPYFAPQFPELNYQSIVRGLQQDKYILQASKMLVSTIGFNKDSKSGQVSNQINITPDVLGKFLGVARQGLARQIGLVSLPVDDIKAVDFDVTNVNVSTDNASNSVKQGFASSEVLFSQDKLNSHQSKLASAVDNNFVEQLYPIFSAFLDYYVNKLTSKYKFHIRFYDEKTPDNYGALENRFKNLSTMGIFDAQLLARMNSMNIFELSRALSISKSFKLDQKLVQLPALSNDNKIGGSKSGAVSIEGRGRPKADPTINDNDNTTASWDRGSNDLK